LLSTFLSDVVHYSGTECSFYLSLYIFFLRNSVLDKDLVKEFEEKYSKIRRARKRKNSKKDRKGKLPGRYMVKILYRWDDKRFNEEYWGRLKRNWKK